MSATKHLFITGMLRSGTTLLEKLINTHHPASCILYQPCMSLFVDVKNVFLTSIGHASELYPLGHLFCESRYNVYDFNKFLEGYRPERWPGLPEAMPSSGRVQGNFIEILPEVWNGLGCCTRSDVIGAKEVLCEEYAPYLATGNFIVIIILRDPRDVIASMNYGDAARYVGAVRPTLYNLHNWRKSVAFALHLKEKNLARYVLYEDLVRGPANQLREIFSCLGTGSMHLNFDVKADLTNHKGEKWVGNSSFDEKPMISETSVCKYKNILPQMLIDYIEAICYPEMVALGYQPELSTEKLKKNFERIISNFREPLAINHTALPADYSTVAVNIAKENKRFKLLNNKYCSFDEAESEYIFIFKELQKIYSDSLFKC